MAYGLRYYAKAQTIAGRAIEVDILQNGYSGASYQRAFGDVPRLRIEGDPIMSSSLEFSLQCEVDEEMADLYTSSATEFQVNYYYAGSLMFTGFITPELYASSYVDPPYDVRITASDNLSELKGSYWADNGRMTVADIFSTLLAATGMSMSVYWCSSISVGGGAANMPATLYCRPSDQEGKTYHVVLEKMLTALHARLVQIRGRWCIFRETDLSGYITSSGYFRDNTYTNLSKVITFGSMNTASVWPVDNLTMDVSPAHSSQKFTFTPDWTEGLMDYYSTSTPPSWRTAVASEVTSAPRMKIRITATCTAEDGQTLKVIVSSPNGQYLRKDLTWDPIGTVPSTYIHEIDLKQGEQDVEIWLPAVPAITTGYSYYTGRFLVIPYVTGTSYTAVSAVYLTAADIWEDMGITVKLTNSARTEADEVELPLFDVDEKSERNWIENAWSLESTYDVPFTTAAITASEKYRTMIVRDYAFSHANPRIKLNGTLSLFGSSAWDATILYTSAGINYVVTSQTFDAYNEEVEVDLISLPASALEVEDISYSVTSASAESTGGSITVGNSSSSGDVTVESSITSSSANPVTSAAIYSALQGKIDTTDTSGYPNTLFNFQGQSTTLAVRYTGTIYASTLANMISPYISASGDGTTIEISTTLDKDSTDATVPSSKTVYDAIKNFVASDGFKTVNGESIIGSGNITVSGGSGGNVTIVTTLDDTASNGTVPSSLAVYDALQGKQDDLNGKTIATINGTALTYGGSITVSGSGESITVDPSITSSSSNPVTSSAIYSALQGKQNTLVSGTSIKTINGTSILGSGDITVSGSSASVGIDTLIKMTPVLTIREEEIAIGSIEKVVRVSHPCISNTSCEIVLMRYAHRDQRLRSTLSGTGYRFMKKGWVVATGYRAANILAYSHLTSSTGMFTFSNLRNYIVKHFMRWTGKTLATLLASSYSTWTASSDTDRGFGRKKSGHARFGIAVRYANPAFTALVDSTKTLAFDTTNIDGVARYIYSPVAPLDAVLRSSTGTHDRRHMEFGLTGATPICDVSGIIDNVNGESI